MALQHYDTYTSVCGPDKFPPADVFENKQLEHNLINANENDENENSLDLVSYNIQLLNTCSEAKLDNNQSLIVIGISRLETGNFSSDAFTYGNNFGGISVDEVPLQYADKEEGCKAFVDLLKECYFDQGLNTVEEIAEKYCPANPSWAELVNELIEEESNGL